jgi:hypothetical protein
MKRRLIRIVIVTLLCSPVVIWARGASGVSVTDFSGWDMGAKATAVQWVFDSPSLGIPAKPTGELNLAYSEATLQSGPAAYGLGSSIWPGQVVAALPPFLQDTIEDNFAANGGPEDFFPVDLPAYPVRAESFFPQGPTTASLDAGTIHMRSNAKETSAEGVSYLNKFEIPFIAAMGNQSSFAQNGFDTQGAVSTVEASATDVSVLNGLFRFDSVVTRATARSDGEKGSVAGTTTITGATMQGVGSIVIDTDGVRVNEEGLGAAAAQQQVNQVLNQFGISMQLSKPVDTIEGPKGSRSLGGLIISVKSETLEPLIAALPAELQTEIRGQFTPDQTIAIQVAPAVVSAAAVKNVEFPITDVGPTAPEAPTTDVGDVSEVPSDDGGVSGTGGTPPQAAGPSTVGRPEITTVRTTFDGVPVWMVILLMLAAFVASRPLTALADRALSGRGGSVGCPDQT